MIDQKCVDRSKVPTKAPTNAPSYAPTTYAPTNAPTYAPTALQTKSPTMKAKCDDKVRNGEETDVDCGGEKCKPCKFNSYCKKDSDCESGYCTFFSKCGFASKSPTQSPVTVSKTHSCTDSVQNGNETEAEVETK